MRSAATAKTSTPRQTPTTTDLQQRLKASAAQESRPDPLAFVSGHIWQIAAHVNVTGPYASAITSRIDRPGYYDDVITDAAILAVVQPLVIADLAEPPAG